MSALSRAHSNPLCARLESNSEDLKVFLADAKVKML